MIMTKLDASRTALLVVHLQNDIVSEGTAFGAIFAAQAAERDVVARANAAMAAVRDHGGLVVTLRIAFREDHSDLDATLPLLQMVQQAGCLKDGTEGAALVAGLEVGEGDLEVVHRRPGPFSDSSLAQLLSEHGVQNVAVCGVATNASVEGAVRQAADLGYRTVLLADAASAADHGSHEASVASMGLFAEILTTDELAAALT
jgi:nicotinamidase-related amidase